MKRAHYGTEVVPAIVQPVIDASIRYGAISRTLSAGDIIWAH